MTTLLSIVFLLLSPLQHLMMMGSGNKGVAAAAGTPANYFLDMEAGNNNDALTATIAGNGAHGTGCTWSVSTPIAQMIVSTASDLGAMLSTFTADSMDYDNTGGTRGWYRDHNDTDDEYVRCTATTNSQVVSTGGWFYTTLGTDALPSFADFDLVQINGNSGADYCVFQLHDFTGSGAYEVRAHGDGTPAGGDLVTLSSSTQYWYTLQYDSTVNATCKLNIYNTGGTQVGSTSTAGIGGTTTVNQIDIGAKPHGVAIARFTRYDGHVFDWTNGLFPLK